MPDEVVMHNQVCKQQIVPVNESPELWPIELKDVSLKIDGQVLIKPLNLRIKRKGITVLMGPNGAGKSLLLRLMHGLLQASYGQVFYAGQVLNAQHRAQQAMVFQRPVLLRRSVAANIDFVLKLRGIKNPELRQSLLGRVALQHLQEQAARRLSGGEQQRLVLARALAMEPGVLFLDEPTANLDPTSTQVIEQIVRQVNEQGTGIVFVTHDVAQARRLADNMVFMHKGEVLEHQRAKEFFQQSKSSKVHAYLNGDLLL